MISVRFVYLKLLLRTRWRFIILCEIKGILNDLKLKMTTLLKQKVEGR